MIYWITGRAKSGKTTLAYEMISGFKKEGKPVLLLDGDDVREQFNNQDYSNFARTNHIMNIANFAAIAEKQGIIVIIALISPIRSIRVKARKLFQESILIYLSGGFLWKDTNYDEPTEEELK